MTDINPAMQYLMSQNSKAGKTSMKSTINKIAQILKNTDLQHFDWAALTPNDLEIVKSTLFDMDRTPNTVNTYLSAMKGIAKAAWLAELMPHERYLMITKVKSIRGSRVDKGRALSGNEVTRMLKEFEGDDLKSIRNRALFLVLVELGLRRAEASRLKINNINFEEQVIQLITKGNKERRVYMTPSVYQALSKLVIAHPLRHNSDAPLFFRIHKGNPVNPEKHLHERSINRLMEEERIKAGVSKFTPHDLRRSLATNLLDHDVDISTVQSIMGHENIATTIRYDKRKDKGIRQIMRNYSAEE